MVALVDSGAIIALYTNVLSSSANWCKFRSWIWLLHSQMVVLFIILALLMFLSTYLGNLTSLDMLVRCHVLDHLSSDLVFGMDWL